MGSPLERSNRDRWRAQVSVPAVRKPLSSSKYSWLQTPWVAVNSPFWWMTRTWSVPSTTTIFISPSAISSTASRSMRLIGAPVLAGSRRRRGRHARRPGIPLRLEQLAQRVLGRRERDARHDGFEEAEDDELARLLGRDPAALEV